MITDEQVKLAVNAYLGRHTGDYVANGNLADMRKALEAYEQSKPKPEPVGYVKTVGGYPDESEHRAEWVVKYRELKDGQPLYTTPPTQEPLSEDFLMKLAEDCTAQFFNGVHQNATIHFARAIEQAHGIC